MLQIGLSRTDITPRAGIEMWGFGKRIQPALGVNDPLTATALVATDGQAIIATVDCDLLFVRPDFTADVRTRVEALAGIPGRNVSITCTHTHYGPLIAPRPAGGQAPSVEEAYRAWLINQLAGLVYEAKRDLQPARIRFGTGTSDIGINRREKTADGHIILGQNPGGFIDRTVRVCRIETIDGVPLAAIVNFATHPVGQDAQLRLISADYVGSTRRIVQELTGAPCLFWQGAAGNINIRTAETDYAASAAAGTRLGQVAAKAWQKACPLADGPVQAAACTLDLPAYRCLSPEHAAQSLRENQLELAQARQDPKSTPGLIEWWEGKVRLNEAYCRSWQGPAHLPPPVPADLQAFRIGALAWACVPGELFNELGVEIQHHSPFTHTLVAAYANDWLGYLPTATAFQEGGYEVAQSCRVAPEAMPIMLAQFEVFFRELSGSC